MASFGAGPGSTVTRKEQKFVLPAGSVAVRLTTFVPGGKALPEAGLAMRFPSEQLSVANVFWLKLTTWGQAPAAVTVMFDGHWIVGGSRSVTMTVNEQLASGVTPFVAVTTTTLVPTGKGCGELMGTLPSLYETVGVGAPVPTLAAKATVREQRPGAVLVLMLGGQVICGGTTWVRRTSFAPRPAA